MYHLELIFRGNVFETVVKFSADTNTSCAEIFFSYSQLC